MCGGAPDDAIEYAKSGYLAELDVPSGSYVNYFAPDKTVENYKGEGVAIKSLTDTKVRNRREQI